MSKTVVTIILAFLIVLGVSVVLYSYSRPVLAPGENINQNSNQIVNDNINNNVNGLADNSVNIFLVALEDNGKTGELIGCGDSLVAVDVSAPSLPDTFNRELTQEEKVKLALENLLAIKERTYGQSGLYNALYQSSLTVKSVVVTAGLGYPVPIGVISVVLEGSFQMNGACDNPRTKAQLEQTVKNQLVDDVKVVITVNSKPLNDVLSGKSEL
ncbi:MAG: hypothetical protein WCW27_03840 [Patescibacteria group bacterium]|jgi:hypothetical protein